MTLLVGLLTLNGYPQRPPELKQPQWNQAADPAVTGGGPVVRFAGGRPLTVRTLPERVALTFNGGPDPNWTPQILDRLAQRGIKATFFLFGNKVNQHPELTRRIVREGHEVGVHSFTEVDLWTLPAWHRKLEIRLGANAIAGVTGYQTALFRPAFLNEQDAMLNVEETVLREAGEAGYLSILSNLDDVLAIEGEDTLARALREDRRYTTVTEAIGAPSALAPAPMPVRLSGALLRRAQQVAAVAATAVTLMLLVALVLAVLRIVMQLAVATRRRDWGAEVVDPVTVIVPAYNESANIAATVTSLARSRYPDLEVIVVDDGSTDGTAEVVGSLGLQRVRVIRQPNGGKPAALNTGLRAARGRLVIMVDGDTVFHPETIYRLVQGFADPTVGAIAGNTKVANTRSLLGQMQHVEYVMYSNLDRRLFDAAGCMTTIPGAVGAYRASVLRQVGGVPADTLAEDTDLTMQVLRAGWRITFEPEAVAWTEAPSSLRMLWRQRYRWSYGVMQAVWKHRRASGPLARRGLPYLLLYQVVFPLVAPAVDIFALYGLFFLPWQQVVLAFGGLMILQTFAAGMALQLDDEPLTPLWTFPLQQILYRQITYLVVLQSAVTALGGNRLRWHRMVRTGAAAHLVWQR